MVLTAKKGISTAGGRAGAHEQQSAYRPALHTGRLSSSQPIDLRKIFPNLLDRANKSQQPRGLKEEPVSKKQGVGGNT